MPTVNIAEFNNSAARVELDYDAVTNAITVLRCVNASERVLAARMQHLVALLDITLVASPGQTTTENLPSGFFFTSLEDILLHSTWQ